MKSRFCTSDKGSVSNIKTYVSNYDEYFHLNFIVYHKKYWDIYAQKTI